MFEFSWWVTAIALLIGCGVQTALGFGMAIVAAPIIVIFKPDWVPVVLTITALMLSIGNSWHLRTNIDWKALGPSFVTRLPGTVIGAWLLTQLSIQSLQLSVAAIVLFAVFVTAWGKPFKSTPTRLGIAGFISGVMGTTTSIGGPPMALIMQHGHSMMVRANLAIYFTYSCITALVSYVWIGRLDWTITIESLSFLPFAALGFWVGKQLQGQADKSYRPLILVMCSLSAVIAIYASFA